MIHRSDDFPLPRRGVSDRKQDEKRNPLHEKNAERHARKSLLPHRLGDRDENPLGAVAQKGVPPQNVPNVPDEAPEGHDFLVNAPDV